MINIAGMDKAEVLAALYNASKPLGLGIYHYTPDDITVEEARELLWLYDRDNGNGAALRVIYPAANGGK